MTQIGEGVAVTIVEVDNAEECVFCGKEHQDEKAESPHAYLNDKNTRNLKKAGQEYIKSGGRLQYYPSADKPPLVDWPKDIRESGGYKAAAHHCLAASVLDNHKISGELKKAGYDPDRGTNCIMLPYSKKQFSRARALNKPLQKHRGGHTNEYYDTVGAHLMNVARKVERKFCINNEKADKERLLRWLESAERQIFIGVVNAFVTAYHLYNNSYLAPDAAWGEYEWEDGITKEDYLDDKEDLAEENAAESESENDPEP